MARLFPGLDALRALRRFARTPHSVPVFEGDRSRRHHDVSLGRLWLRARAHRWRARAKFRAVETFVQFAGFPRSGHSLIGSLLDAHPNARISHELDTMGLLKKGFPPADIFSLIDEQALAFTQHGRYWNGFSYLVPGGSHAASGQSVRVIGDKKGDLAVRWIARDARVLDRLQAAPGGAKKWILVLRDPFDNISTMSLRKGRAYDVLRTTLAPGEDFGAALRQRQEDGQIAREALDSEIEDYARLCETIATMKTRTEPGDWFELGYEDFAAEPAAGIRRLLSFLGLPASDDYVTNGARLVHTRVNRSRDALDWPESKRARVRALIDEFSFLHRYREHADD